MAYAAGRARQPELLVVDWLMPGMDGLSVCRAIRKRAQDQYVYVLPTATAIRHPHVGAAGRPVTALERLRIEATQDSLTGLLNRGATLDALDREIARAAREGVAMTVIMSDVDHFKEIDDTYGHAAGDHVLKEAARRMRRFARAGAGVADA